MGDKTNKDESVRKKVHSMKYPTVSRVIDIIIESPVLLDNHIELAIALQLRPAQYSQLKKSVQSGAISYKEFFRQMFYPVVEQAGSKFTIAKLDEALKEIECNDAAEKLTATFALKDAVIRVAPPMPPDQMAYRDLEFGEIRALIWLGITMLMLMAAFRDPPVTKSNPFRMRGEEDQAFDG